MAGVELEGPDERKQPFTRLSLSGAEPAAQVGACPVQDAYPPIARIRFPQAGPRELTAGAAFVEGCGRRLEARGTVRSEPARFALTFGVAVEATSENVLW
jgi:hypothetical protein